MRPISVTMAPFGVHRDLTVEFPDGCVSLTGANGAGKSTILRAVEVALFGAEGRSLAPYVPWDGDTMSVELEFEHGGRRYRVRRQVVRGKSTMELERAGTDERDLRAAIATASNGIDPGLISERWMPLSAETPKQTQEKLEALLGFSRRTLRASSLLMQSDAGVFCDSDPRERKAILADVLGLERYAALHDAVVGDRRQAQADAQRLAGKLDALGDADMLDEQRQTTEVALADTLTALGDATDALKDAEDSAASWAAEAERLREAGAQRRTLVAEHAAAVERARSLRLVEIEAQTARERADAVRTENGTLEKLAGEHAGLTATLADLEERQRQVVEARAARERFAAEHGRLALEEGRLLTEAARISAEIVALDEAEHPECPTCHQAVDTVARASVRASYEADREATTEAATETRARMREALDAASAIVEPEPVVGIDETRARVAELADSAARLAAGRERLAQLEATVAKAETVDHRFALSQAEASEATLTKFVADLPPVDEDAETRAALSLAGAQARVSAQREAHAAASARVPVLQERLDAIAQRAAEIVSAQAGLAVLTLHAQRLAQLEQAYGPNGIPLLILENAAIPAIEAEANDVLGRLGGKTAGWHVELRTQTATLKGELRDALDVVVHTGPLQETDYAQLSGGEKTRVAIALRLGVARLLANRRGADCRLLALDEPDALDAEGKQALVEILQERAASYSTVILISHDSDLRDRFDHSLELTAPTDDREPVVA